MRTTDLEHVQTLAIFNEMKRENFARLTDAALLQRIPAGFTLIHEGTLPDFLHVLVDGMVEIFTEQKSGPVGIALVRPVAPLILAAIVVDQPYLNSARALTDSRVLLLPAERVREIFGLDGGFARALVTELALAYRGTIKKLKSQMARSSTERLANWILAETGADGRDSVTIPFDRATLASHIGITRENLSRSLSQLTAHGVRVRGRDVIVIDRQLLETFAQPHPLIDDPAA